MDPDAEGLKLRRSMRIRMPPAAEAKIIEQKCIKTEDVEKYYLDKTVPRTTASLETIYEDPEAKEAKGQAMSKRKYRRHLQFAENIPAAKIKKRQLKAKELCCKFFSRKKLSMATFLKKLEKLEKQ